MNIWGVLISLRNFIYESTHWIGFYFPMLLFIIFGALYYPSWFWALYLFVFYANFRLIYNISSNLVTINDMRDAAYSFFLKDKVKSLQEINIDQYIEGNTHNFLQSSISTFLNKNKYLQKSVGVLFSGKPTRAFVVNLSGGFLDAAKAYVGVFGSSYIFLSRPVEEMKAHQKFVFFHELEHTKSRGSFYLTHAYESKIWFGLNLLFLLFFMSKWWHWLFFAAYASIFYTSKIAMKNAYNEVMADHAAILQLDPADREIVVNDNIKMRKKEFESSLKKGRNVKSERELLLRVFYFEEWKRNLERGSIPPPVMWTIGVPIWFSIGLFITLFLIGKSVAFEIPRPLFYINVLTIVPLLFIFFKTHKEAVWSKFTIEEIIRSKENVTELGADR